MVDHEPESLESETMVKEALLYTHSCWTKLPPSPKGPSESLYVNKQTSLTLCDLILVTSLMLQAIQSN